MKCISILFFCLLCYFASSQSSQFEGNWTGNLAQTLNFNLQLQSDTTGSCLTYLSIPMQGVDSLKASSCDLNGDTLKLTFKISLNQEAQLVGVYQEDKTISAYWHQGVAKYAINFKKAATPEPPVRPQEPSAPYPYTVKEVSFTNTLENFKLAGTLTRPDSNYLETAVILISGSGAQDRNSETLGHKPFLVLADYLTSKGIAVLRYDDRGVGLSEGARYQATSKDFADDVMAGLNFLDSLGFKNLGCIGHSEGALIAQLVAVQYPKTDFVVSLAGPGIPISEIMLLQNKFALNNYGFDALQIHNYLIFQKQAYQLIADESPKDSIYGPLKNLAFDYYNEADTITQKTLGPSPDAFYISLASQYLKPWFRYFINYDPSDIIPRITCPILALNGSLDVQITSKENLEAYRKHLNTAEQPDSKILELTGLNHLFQTAITGNTGEYYQLTETFNPEALELIYDWISKLKFP